MPSGLGGNQVARSAARRAAEKLPCSVCTPTTASTFSLSPAEKLPCEEAARKERSESSARPQRKATVGGGCGRGWRLRLVETAKAKEAAVSGGGGGGEGGGVGPAWLGLIIGAAVGEEVVVMVAVLGVVERHCYGCCFPMVL